MLQNLFSPSHTKRPNKLECSSPASLFSQVLFCQKGVAYLSGAAAGWSDIKKWALNCSGWSTLRCPPQVLSQDKKAWQGGAYMVSASVMKKRSCMRLRPGRRESVLLKRGVMVRVGPGREPVLRFRDDRAGGHRNRFSGLASTFSKHIFLCHRRRD